MKKFLLLIPTLLLFVGCNEQSHPTSTQYAKYKKAKNLDVTCVDGLEMYRWSIRTGYGVTYKRNPDNSLRSCDYSKFSKDN